MNDQCIGCGAQQVECLIDLGAQPPSNRYLVSADAATDVWPLKFGVCRRCSLAQLIEPMSPAITRSRFSWITYNEPEGHLDDLVQKIRDRGFLTENAAVLGVSYKDDTTLARCARGGVKNTHRFDQEKDLGIEDSLASLETIQQQLSLPLAGKLAEKYGKADVLVVRHILEHAHQPRHFVRACTELTKPGGLMIFEMPDCRKVFDGNDHCFLWEEHISYFTPETLRIFLTGLGFDKFDIQVYPYPMEDSLVAIVVNQVSDVKDGASTASNEEILRAENFAKSYERKKTEIGILLDKYIQQGRRLALFGAGHLAAKYVNFYNLKDRFAGVIDDNAHKQHHYLPGSGLPVIDSKSLETGEVDFCLSTLSPESEAKVRKAKEHYLKQGGQFRSIFSASASSIDKDL